MEYQPQEYQFQVNKSSVLEISASLTDKPPPKKCYTLEFQN